MPWEGLIVDPGFGFGKTPDHNLALLASLGPGFIYDLAQQV